MHAIYIYIYHIILMNTRFVFEQLVISNVSVVVTGNSFLIGVKDLFSNAPKKNKNIQDL